jgi:hypothetical protein
VVGLRSILQVEFGQCVSYSDVAIIVAPKWRVVAWDALGFTLQMSSHPRRRCDGTEDDMRCSFVQAGGPSSSKGLQERLRRSLTALLMSGRSTRRSGAFSAGSRARSSGDGLPSVIERLNDECMDVSSCRPQGQPVFWLLRRPVSSCSSPQRAKGARPRPSPTSRLRRVTDAGASPHCDELRDEQAGPQRSRSWCTVS